MSITHTLYFYSLDLILTIQIYDDIRDSSENIVSKILNDDAIECRLATTTNDVDDDRDYENVFPFDDLDMARGNDGVEFCGSITNHRCSPITSNIHFRGLWNVQD
jgi:hypothetical protein